MLKRNLIAIAILSMALFLTSDAFGQQATETQQGRFRADTGIITLAPNQILRLTISVWDDTDVIHVRFRRMTYAPEAACVGGVCKLAAASQTVSDTITLTVGEAASFDIPNAAFGVRGVISGNGNVGDAQKVRMTATIINTSTGEATSHIIIANTEGDFH